MMLGSLAWYLFCLSLPVLWPWPQALSFHGQGKQNKNIIMMFLFPCPARPRALSCHCPGKQNKNTIMVLCFRCPCPFRAVQAMVARPGQDKHKSQHQYGVFVLLVLGGALPLASYDSGQDSTENRRSHDKQNKNTCTAGSV